MRISGITVRSGMAFIALAALALPASAATYCTGQVLTVAMNPTGTVWANVQGVGNKAYCDVYVAKVANMGLFGTYAIPTVGCQALYSTLLTAKATQTPVTLVFDTTAPVVCDGNGAPSDWFGVFPMYVSLGQ